MADATPEVLLERDEELAELERDFGFGVVRQLFASVASGDGDSGEGNGATALVAAVLGGQPPARAGRGPDGAYATLEALTRLAARLSGRTGLALLVDDAHWADAASLRFLAYLARRVRGIPLVLVMSARDGTEVGATEVDAVLADSDTRSLEPGPLSARAAERLVRATLPETSLATCNACHAATGGNPLFLHELVRTLSASAAGDPRDVLAVVPPSAVEAIRVRLRRLTAPAARLATAIAVLGDDTLLRHAAASELPPTFSPAIRVATRRRATGCATRRTRRCRAARTTPPPST